MDFKLWLEHWSDKIKKREPLAIMALECWSHEGSAGGAGGDYDTTDHEVYMKHLGLSREELLKKYYSNSFYARDKDEDGTRSFTSPREYQGEDPLPSIEGVHWGWYIHITPEASQLLIGNTAIYQSSYETTYYHDGRNYAGVLILLKAEQIPQLSLLVKEGQIQPLSKARKAYSDEKKYQWGGLNQIIRYIAKKQNISLPSSMGLKPVPKAPFNRQVHDPRLFAKKRPAEDREGWLRRAVDIQHGDKVQKDPTGYNPLDLFDLYFKDSLKKGS